ncbi:MAG: ATP-binding cassette domain-containing protein [Casimicrobiaceae bacterium]|nr:ATP-binding cassette domain-containing protein [Casimicrobiaceae bacterium]MCX8098449.1 ATP-binding cassette domain-containing protein [Casimicrobiaceae bacterium]MDW8311161.1 ATP-binding cassette domain-containing protein [Burkholderiales bacterium]
MRSSAEHPACTPPSTHLPPVSSPAAIEAQGLTRIVRLGERSLTILEDVSLTVAAGATQAIVGASGSGKTTLLGLLAGLDRPDAGMVRWFGEPVSQLSEDEIARRRQGTVGFVFQSFQLLPALTALENVMLPLDLAGASDARARAVAWLERVGLGARLDHLPRQLSGGEQQRVAIARAFVAEPKIVFADEPTGNLDTDTGHDIAELMFRLNREQGTTLVLVTHDLELARRCDALLRLARGRISREAAA